MSSPVQAFSDVLPGHLGEDEDSRSLCLHLRQQLIQHCELATVLYKMLISCVWWARLDTIKEVRMVGALSQLHQDVLQSHLLNFASSVDNIDVFHENFGVELALHLGKANVQVDLLLWQERLLDVGLQTTQ